MTKEIEDYKLIPMSEITDEAREIAKRWYDGVSEMNDIREKHKLASDIMNYARRHSLLTPSADVQELKWNDGKTLSFDETIRFSHAYDFEGLELMAQEAVTPKGRVVVWPEHLRKDSQWSYYFEHDGCFRSGLPSVEAAKGAVLKHLNTDVQERAKGYISSKYGNPVERGSVCSIDDVGDAYLAGHAGASGELESLKAENERLRGWLKELTKEENRPHMISIAYEALTKQQ